MSTTGIDDVMDDDVLVTQSEAARILGRSVSTISRAIAQGKLQYADSTKRLLDRRTLVDDFLRGTRPRIDRPINQPDSSSEWELIAQYANEMLEPALWGPPPWSADRWAALAGVLELSMESI